MQQEILRSDRTRQTLFVFSVALCGSLLGLLFCSMPILVPVVIELVFAALFLLRPTVAIQLMLLSAGLPLNLLYQDVSEVGSGGKPLFADWGGTTPDGLRLIVSCILMCVVLMRLGRTRRLLVQFWPYMALLILMACSLAYSKAPVDGLRLLMKIAFPFLMFLVLVQLSRSTEDVEAYGKYWIAGGIIASICAPILVLFEGNQFLYSANEFRYGPGFTSASSFSFYMLALFLFCYARWRIAGSVRFALLAGLFGVQTIMPMTRIAWAGLLVGVATFEFFYAQGRKRWAVAAGIGLAPILILYAMVWQLPALQERVFQTDRIDSDVPAMEQAQSIGLTGRGTVWLAGFTDYREHNVYLGQGIGSSDRYLMNLFGTVAHNEYLRVLYDCGAIGLLAFVVANGFLLRWLARLREHTNIPVVRGYLALGSALVLAYLVIALTDNPLEYYLLFTQFVFFILAICAVSADAPRV